MEDSWLTSGDCKKCRRKDYCSKQCKAHRSLEAGSCKRVVQDAVREGYKRIYGGKK